ncbi:MAG: ATP-binding protein [bacterium]|nr:ATP-binding protein [bacterium]
MQTQVNILFVVLASAIFALLLVAFIVIFLNITQKRSFKYNENLLRIKQEYDSAILNSQIEVQAQTLKEISEELHDNVGQILSSVILHIKVIGEKAPVNIQKQIEDTKSLVTEIKEQVRHISRSISPQHIENFGLFNAITYQADRINRIGAIKIELKTEGKEKKYNPRIELVLFRMVQELINNAIKHSECENIYVKLNYVNEVLTISVKDDGKGFDETEILRDRQFRDGTGLHSLENKAKFINCSITFNSGEKGTKVTIIKDFENEYY